METCKHTAHASVDSFIHARQAKFTINLLPVTQLLAFLDWFLNLADSPGTQYRILEDFMDKNKRYWDYICRTMINNDGEPEKPIAVDSRFKMEKYAGRLAPQTEQGATGGDGEF